MKTSLRISSVFSFALLSFFLIHSISFSQNNNFVGTKTIREGNKVMLKTLPSTNAQSIESVSSLKLPLVTSPKHVLGGTVVWTFQDGAAMGNYTRLNGDGAIPLVGWGLNQMRASLYNEFNSSPAWEFSTIPNDPAVAISDDGSIIAVSSGTDFYLLDKATGAVRFQFTLPDSLYASQIAVSRSGDQVMVLAEALGNSKTAIAYHFNTTHAVPVITWKLNIDKSIITNWAGVRFNASGTDIVITGRNHMYLMDSTGMAKWDTFVDNTESPAVISGDAKIIATADNSGFVKTYLRNTTGTQYKLLWQYKIPGTSSWASSIGLSNDGRTVLAGSLIFLPAGYDGSVTAFDTYGSGTPKWIYSGCGDLVDDIAVSDDGKVAAAVTWGDMDHLKGDLLVFDVETGLVTFEIVSPGSFFSVDMSHDGKKVIAGGKGVHARYFGSGGLVYYASIELGGGNVAGTVNTGTTDKSGVLVQVQGTSRTALTANDGSYTIKNIAPGTYTVKASKPGYSFGTVTNVNVTEGNTTSNVNFNLTAYTTQPPLLAASTTLLRAVRLSFTGLLTERMKNEIAKAVGDPFIEENTGVLSASDNGNKKLINDAPLYGLADSIAIFRSIVPGGPYTRIASVLRTQTSYNDSSVFPLKNYYYVVNVFNETGQSIYSNEVLGKVSDTLLTFNFSAPQGTVPNIDGVISAGEWADAFKVDVSDVLGYSGGSPKPQGTAFMYFKFDNTTKMLYVAGEDFLNPTLDDNEGFGLYFDDNNNNAYEPSGALSVLQEGNYWAYWHPSGANLRFRRLYTGGGAGTVDTIMNALVNFSQSSGHLQGEVAIPLGFSNGNQLQLFSPDRTPGLGAFIRETNTGFFDGWWPQTMNSLFNPQYFGDVKINATLTAPPQIPSNITVTQDWYDLVVKWSDPTLGLNNDPLASTPKIRIFKNGKLLKVVSAGVQSFKDTDVDCMFWYEYKLDAFIVTGSDTFYGPVSKPVGEFACKAPTLTPLAYDDGLWDLFYIVGDFLDNKFALRVTPTFYPARVVRLETLVNGAGEFDFTVNADSSGFPGKVLSGPYRVSSGNPGMVSPVILTIPGNETPMIETGDFWVLINYLPNSPYDPGIGTDATPPNYGRGMFYQSTTGWLPMTGGNLMITTYVTDTSMVVGVNDPISSEIPGTYELMQNYPNPFNPSTVIHYQLPEAQHVTVEIFNSLGQKVTTLVNETKNAGKYNVTWNGKNDLNNAVSSGMYLYRIKAGNFVQSRKMLFMK